MYVNNLSLDDAQGVLGTSAVTRTVMSTRIAKLNVQIWDLFGFLFNIQMDGIKSPTYSLVINKISNDISQEKFTDLFLFNDFKATKVEAVY